MEERGDSLTGDAELDAALWEVIEAEELDEARWRVLGEINNRLVSRHDPDHLAIWWRQPHEDLDGRIPESIVTGEFDPKDQLVQRLLQVVQEKAEAGGRWYGRM